MNAIFLCNSPENVRRVYDATAISRLRALCALDEHIYSAAELDAIPEDTEIVFSTWGMPTLTEAQIARHLPRLQCRSIFSAGG